MLRVIAVVNNRRTLFLGLDRMNTDRMHDDKPIPVDVQALTQGADIDGPIQDVILFARETPADVHAELSRFLPLPPFEEPQP